MFSLKRQLKLLGAVMAVVVVGVIAASPAMAAIVPANFSSSTIKLTSTGVTLKHNLESRTCTPYSGSIPGEGMGNAMILNYYSPATWSCSSAGWWDMGQIVEAGYDTTAARYFVQVRAGGGSPLRSPWGYYETAAFKGTWVNGSGATPSTLKFENATIGLEQKDWKPTLVTGTLTAKTGSGGLITLSH